MDKIAKESCGCLDKISDTLKSERYTQELGLCMIGAAIPYKKQIKKDHHIDLDNLGPDGEKLGQLIALQMTSVCPNALLTMGNKVNEDEGPDKDKDIKLFEGRITKVDSELFVSISARDESGKTIKFYWLTSVESNIDLIEKYASLGGELIRISYRTEELFDAKIKEYRQFAVIEKIEVIKK